ncbi:unnamed protein product [Arabidopsis arenosa]|uniref:Uncharacterized protein n=1 Tax=Arabidopsis arenosa TaxID=38785 RepID=A0A8S2AMK1_ARAAE|nr:unnamed protein product [Arabidopsis arenosa]
MASGPSKTEAETAQIVSTAPIETTTEESAVSSSLNKDKSDSDPKENDSSNDEDSIVDDGDSASDQSEWGVDSFDDEEYFHLMKTLIPTKKLREKPVFINGISTLAMFGFLVEEGIGPRPRSRSVGCGYILLKSLDSEHSPAKGRTQLQYAQDMAKLSLRKYNALNTSYITFMAKESKGDDTLVEYQAKGFYFISIMASGSSKTETESTQIVSTTPIETTTEESAVSYSLNKDKSDSDPKENDSSNDEDSIVDDGDSASDQSEWGVDSFDDKEYISPDEDTHTDEEVERKSRIYERNLHFSHGFLVEEGFGPRPRPRSVGGGYISLVSLDSERSPVKGRTQLQYAQDMAKLSLRKYNALNETNLKLDHVVRVTQGPFFMQPTSYITFMAKESEEDDTLVEYQAKVAKKLNPKRKTYPMFCKPSPKLDLDM